MKYFISDRFLALALIASFLIIPNWSHAELGVGDCLPGTITVDSNSKTAAYYLTRPNGQMIGWNGSHIFQNSEVGLWSIRADDVPGFSKTISGTSGRMICGGTLSTTITYTPINTPAPIPVYTNVPEGSAVTVTTPNGGERWVVGNTVKIGWRRNWMPKNANGLVDIYYRRTEGPNQLSQLIASGVSDQTGYSFVVPKTPVGNDYKIVVTSRGSGGSATTPLSDESDAVFSVVVPDYGQTPAPMRPLTATGNSTATVTVTPASDYVAPPSYRYTPSTGTTIPLYTSVPVASYVPWSYKPSGTNYGLPTSSYAPAPAGWKNKTVPALNEQLAPVTSYAPSSYKPSGTNSDATTSTTSEVSLSDIHDGNAIQAGSGPVWLVKISNDATGTIRSRRQVPSLAFRFNKIATSSILHVSDAVLTRFVVANLVRVGTGRNIYLVQFSGGKGTRKLFPNTSTLLNMGYALSQVQTITSGEYALYKAGGTLPKVGGLANLQPTPSPSFGADISNLFGKLFK